MHTRAGGLRHADPAAPHRSPLLMGVFTFTDRPPPSPPTDVSAYMAGLLCRRLLGVYDLTLGVPPSPPTGVSAYIMPLLLGVYNLTLGLPPSPSTGVSATRLAYYAAVVGRPHLHRRPTSVVADWCFRRYSWLVTPPFMGVHVFTDRLAFAAADWCFYHD